MAKMRVIVTDSGEISLFADEGTFKAGKDNLEFLLKVLEVSGIEFASKGQVEQHRHGPDGEHVHSHSHADAGHTH